ncbi:MAG TPA: amidase [Gemmataceae bacterium]|nr:amidase [Gemmataceae bacterium]
MFPTIQAASEAIRSGQSTPIDLLDQCLQRTDKYEDKIKAWVYLDRDGAREQAEKLTAELKARQNRGPLHGIPIGIKDIIDVFDMPTAAGSKLWANSIAREDADLVKKLRQAGAIIMGKLTTTQYASFDPSPTRNPWNLERTPGGSSSGPAAAVACGMCLGAIGSQTGGSITRPAAYCGIASCKPSHGLVSGKGLVPLAPSMDHPGPMARSIWDLAVMLETTAEDSGLDLMSGLAKPHPVRFGRPRGLFEDLAAPIVKAITNEVEKTLRDCGSPVDRVALPAAFSEVLSRHRMIMAVEAAVYHEQRLMRHPEDYKPNITKLLQEGLACPAPEYARCKEHQWALRASATQWFGRANVLLTPATTSAAPDMATTGDPAFNSPWSYTGLPTVSIPVGRDQDGMPLSIQLVGRQSEESVLFAAAAWCEKVLAQPLLDPPC